MNRIIAPASRQTVTETEHVFAWRDTPDAGYSFRIAADGEPIVPNGVADMVRERVANGELIDKGLVTYTYEITTGPMLRCDCGREIELILRNYCTTCDCGRDYNASGQLLAPREQWGEETGENWTDLIGPIPEDTF